MSEEEQSGEKSHEPSEQRLQEARDKGDIPKSTDLSAAAAYIGLVVAVFLAGAAVVQGTGIVMMSFLSRADTLAPRVLAMGGGGITGQMALEASWTLLPIFGVPFILVLGALVAQRAVVFAPDKLVPKLNRISPIAQAMNKFGPTGLVEFAKAALKLFAISILMGLFLLQETDRIVGLVRATPVTAMREMADISINLLIQIAIIAVAIGAIDYFWQRFDHARKLRMTFQEVRDEFKHSEGDPFVKGQRRRRGEDIVKNRMMLDVPDASVVIVNPTHYAVALKWDRTRGGAPIVVAKGVDDVAFRIREVAERSKVPIHSDPPTARALDVTTEIGQEINPDHYKAVAAAIRFAEAMRKRARERGA
ncbi:MAG: flagellar type III secretion system protein FlhB [Pseudomonadota bacterium]